MKSFLSLAIVGLFSACGIESGYVPGTQTSEITTSDTEFDNSETVSSTIPVGNTTINSSTPQEGGIPPTRPEFVSEL